MVSRLLLYTLIGLMLSACAGKTGNDFRVSLGFVSAFDVAKTEFHQGLFLESRKRLLSIQKDDKDYPEAQAFFKRTVEPARLKLLRYYVRKAKAEEKRGEWAKAEEDYRMAAELSQQPQALLTYQKNMNLKARQLRLNSLYAIRKNEDLAWLDWKKGYTPPIGLLGDDKAFSEASTNFAKLIEERLLQTKKLSEKYKRDDEPELAWLYADSYLRLKPGDKKAQNLKNAMATAVPQGFILPKEGKKVEAVKVIKVKEEKVTSQQVNKLIAEKKWLSAKEKALELRRQGDSKADMLLKKINTKISEMAEDAYQKGNIAFRTENIDGAVSFWQKAVDLKPDEQTYVDSLRRGKQIQERLKALKAEDK